MKKRPETCPDEFNALNSYEDPRCQSIGTFQRAFRNSRYNMIDEIQPGKIYTPKEAQDFLKISESTMKRMIKNGVIRAYKVSGQYRIWGNEILKLTAPQFKYRIWRFYMKIKNKVIHTIKRW